MTTVDVLVAPSISYYPPTLAPKADLQGSQLAVLVNEAVERVYAVEILRVPGRAEPRVLADIRDRISQPRRIAYTM